MLAKETASTNVKDSRFVRYAAFCTVWFIAVPLAGAFLVVWLLLPTRLGSGWSWDLGWPPGVRPRTAGAGVHHRFHTAGDAPLGPATALPGAGLAGVAGRTDLPGGMRRRFEDAGGLLDEADRILERRPRDIERALTAKERDDLRGALDRLRDSMKKEPFDVEEFNVSLGKAEQQVDVYLSSWRKSEMREYAESIGIAVAVALALRAFVVEAFKIPSGSMIPTLQVGDHIFVNKFAYGPIDPVDGTRALFAAAAPARRRHGLPVPRETRARLHQARHRHARRQARGARRPSDHQRMASPRVQAWAFTSTPGATARCRSTRASSSSSISATRHFLTFFDHAMSPSSARASGAPAASDSECEPGLSVSRRTVRRSTKAPISVKAGEVWVMGDNRNNSHDSRGWWDGKGGGVPFENIKGRALIVWMSFAPQGIAWDRIGITVMGRPKIPPDQVGVAAARPSTSASKTARRSASPHRPAQRRRGPYAGPGPCPSPEDRGTGAVGARARARSGGRVDSGDGRQDVGADVRPAAGTLDETRGLCPAEVARPSLDEVGATTATDRACSSRRSMPGSAARTGASGFAARSGT